MTTEIKETKYRILESFIYSGKDGKSDKPVTLAPGEDVPELDTEERERLLETNKICEIFPDGENKPRMSKSKERIELSETELMYLMPNARTLKFLSQNRLTKKSLLALRERIIEGIGKYNLPQNYFTQEVEEMIRQQLLYIE